MNGKTRFRSARGRQNWRLPDEEREAGQKKRARNVPRLCPQWSKLNPPNCVEKNGGDDGTRNVARSRRTDENAQVADSTGNQKPLKTEIEGSPAEAGYKKSTGPTRLGVRDLAQICCASPLKNSGE